MNDYTPKPLNARQESQRAKMLAAIREARRKFWEEFPDGCRVEFQRGPATAENPTIRIGKGTIVSKYSTHDGRLSYVHYTLDENPSRTRIHECMIQTFLRDNPVRIEDDQ